MEQLNRTGIAFAESVPWGTHICQLYETKTDLLEVLVPFFAEGLKANDAGVWITSDPISPDEAKAALKAAVPNLDEHLAAGRMEFISHEQWYLQSGELDVETVLNEWATKLSEARDKGFDGLRASGNAACLKDGRWNDLKSYEERVQATIGGQKLLAVCTYPLDQCNASELLEIVRLHDYAVIRRNGNWEGIESTLQRPAEKAGANVPNRCFGKAKHDTERCSTASTWVSR